MRVRVESDHGTGWTADASAGGMFFVLPETIEEGTELSFSLVLPREGQEQRLQCRARVIRTKPGKEGIGVAAELVSWEFEDTAPNP
jgi:hypothetical protein